MKTFNDLTATTELENGAILPANNAANTVTNKITFADLKNQIRGSLISGVSLSGTTLTVTHADDESASDADVFTTQDTWTAMVGATSETNGTAGYVPAPPSTGYNTKFLRADGTWTTVEQITVDSTLSNSSENPLQNKAVYNALALKANTADLGTAAAKNITNTYSSTSEDAMSGKAVAEAIANLPEPMIFKGTLGADGTINSLPAASSSGSSKNIGFTYKVITAGTYQGITAAVGDTLISTGTTWALIPSGDEPTGTVTSVGITNGTGISVSGGPITSSGSITVSHGDTSDQTSVSNSGRTYVQSITLDDYGHVTNISSGTESVTDTHYASETVAAATSAGKADTAATNGNVYLNHVENDTVVSSHNIVGSGATSVTSDANGVITISSSNTTYTPASLGFGYATCSTANGTAAKTASLTDYELTTGGFVAVKFTYAVDASATLSINSQTAKSIFYQGAAIGANDIPAGSVAILVYDGTQYNLVGLIPALVNALDGGDEG